MSEDRIHGGGECWCGQYHFSRGLWQPLPRPEFTYVLSETTPAGNIWAAMRYTMARYVGGAEMPVKPSWDEYFLNIAAVVATRSSCIRRKIGAVIVSPDHRIVATGYNDSPPGGWHCETGCPRAKSDVPAYSSYSVGPGRCIAVHAEANALLWAGRDACLDATLYCTCEPCQDCSRLIVAAGIDKVVIPSEVLGFVTLSPDTLLQPDV